MSSRAPAAVYWHLINKGGRNEVLRGRRTHVDRDARGSSAAFADKPLRDVLPLQPDIVTQR
jgi:hypothetical protein